jgi:predicted ATPase
LAAAWKVAPQRLIQDAAQRWPELAFIIPDLLIPTNGTPVSVDSEATQLRVFQRARQFLHALTEIQPTVLVLEDLHWADATSLGSLLHLARNLADERLLIVGTYRDADVTRQHPLDACLRELVRERVVDEIHLVGLPRDGTGALARARLGDLASDELIHMLHDRSGGNPFFAHELVKAIQEQGVPARGQSNPFDEIDIPRSVRSVVAGRVARLTPGAQAMLAPRALSASSSTWRFCSEPATGTTKRRCSKSWTKRSRRD